jgi:hypothetical protein
MGESTLRKGESISAYEAAVKEAIAERRSNAHVRADTNAQLEKLNTRDAELATLITNLLAFIPAERRALYHADEPPPEPGNSSMAFGTVVKLIPKGREWTAPKMATLLSAEGVSAKPKQIHNILNYLARTGRLRRVGRGRYLYMGVLIETSDEMPEMDDPVRFID